MSNIDSDRVGAAIDEYLHYLEKGGTPPSLDELNDGEKTEASAAFRLLDACWGVDEFEVPPLEEDPIAREMGLINQAESPLQLRGPSVSSSRKRRSLTIKQVAEWLAAKGHSVDTAWVFKLEQREAIEVDPELAKDISQLLGVSIESLLPVGRVGRQNSLQVFLRSANFRQIVNDWSRAHRMDAARVAKRAELELVGAAQRSHGEPGVEEWERLLRALLRSWQG